MSESNVLRPKLEACEKALAESQARVAQLEGALRDIVNASRDEGLSVMCTWMRNRAAAAMVPRCNCDSAPVGVGCPVHPEESADYIRAARAALRAVVFGSRPAPSVPDCEVCGYPPSAEHHHYQRTKGYHPFVYQPSPSDEDVQAGWDIENDLRLGEEFDD